MSANTTTDAVGELGGRIETERIVAPPNCLLPAAENLEPCRSPAGFRRRWKSALLFFVLLAAAAYGAFKWAAVPPPAALQRALLPTPFITGTQVGLHVPGHVLTADLVAYQDELFAYLMFDYLRHRPALQGMKLLLTFNRADAEAPYRLVLKGQRNLVASIANVSSLQVAGSMRANRWQLSPEPLASEYERQTELFVSAYNLPVRRKLEHLPRQSVSGYLRRFIRFKSTIDPRIRLNLEPVPKPLSSAEAQQLAGDIITVAKFYSLPLEFFLGIGAMENNYMNVRGDLKHSIWKRRAAADDVILERKRGRVRVLNDSAGVWQITRETLRYADRLVKNDTRDYTLLPEHLRPPEDLKINEVDPHVLTTYAGILLRDLLDRFDGDVTLAVSAYNGGPGRPNLQYGEGVHRAAAHARRVLEQSAALNGETVVGMTWLRRP
jgi:hypothetical protein